MKKISITVKPVRSIFILTNKTNSNDSMDNMHTVESELDENNIIRKQIESELQKLCIFTDTEKDIILGLMDDG